MNGNYGFVNNQGQLYTGDDQFVTKLTIALENLRSGTNGQKLVNYLMNSTHIVEIGRARSNQKKFYRSERKIYYLGSEFHDRRS